MANLGVSGHRFLVEEQKIIQGINLALDRIQTTFPGECLRVFSQLAEGSDRLVATQILNRKNIQLVVILPLPLDEYLDDFKFPESKAAFLSLYEQANEVIQLPPTTSKDAAYSQAGFYLLEHCDVMIVIWDGEIPQGPGGTGEIAAGARAKDLPMAWVLAGNRLPGTDIPTSLGEDQGSLRLENFP